MSEGEDVGEKKKLVKKSVGDKKDASVKKSVKVKQVVTEQKPAPTMMAMIRRTCSQLVLIPFAFLFGIFEMIVIDSAISTGAPQLGALQCLIMVIVLLGVPAVLLPFPADRHRYLSRCLVGSTVIAILGIFVLAGKVETIRKANRNREVVKTSPGPTIAFLGLQLAGSIAYVALSQARKQEE